MKDALPTLKEQFLALSPNPEQPGSFPLVEDGGSTFLSYASGRRGVMSLHSTIDLVRASPDVNCAALETPYTRRCRPKLTLLPRTSSSARRRGCTRSPGRIRSRTSTGLSSTRSGTSRPRHHRTRSRFRSRFSRLPQPSLTQSPTVFISLARRPTRVTASRPAFGPSSKRPAWTASVRVDGT